ncbi:MAG: hypothetical protein KUG69_08955 [Marinosulfonomonas sp.]|nr:hypothetical protein [Marinosulfonomonas sp.]
MGFLLRWLFAFTLIAATYNPTDLNYSRWALENYTQEMPLTLLFGLILLVGYIIYFRATLRSIGGLGMFLVFAVFAALVWVLYDRELLSLKNTALNVWMGILALSLVLGIGLSWSFVRRALSGQFDVDDTEE